MGLGVNGLRGRDFSLRFSPMMQAQYVRKILCGMAILPLFLMQAGHASSAAIAITGVKITASAQGERVTLNSRHTVNGARVMTLPNPPRIVIDLPLVRATNISLPKNYAGSTISAIRFGQFDKNTSRIVIDLKRALASGQVMLSHVKQGGIAIDIANQRVSKLSSQIPSQRPSESPKTSAPVVPAQRVMQEKPLIVIDAGHGGQDPGALGVRKTIEKNVTLATAQAIKKALLATGRYRVMLTREDDRFIMLGDRVNIARKHTADMFISVHADSNPEPQARGLSIYTISDTASDAATAALAARENAVDDLSGMKLDNVDKDVADILLDLAAHETKTKSAQLADILVSALNPKITKLSKTHRYAGFRVLKAPDIPSVLIELGFLTNASDEAHLTSPEYRALIASSIVKGIDAYYVTIKRR
jgi:N-acetylmuramoyl-L-alanine amidase